MKERSRVVIVPCDSYDKEQVYRAMRSGIAALGGLSALLSAEENILVKPNFLSAAAADKAVTTHPSVIEAMLRILHEDGCLHVAYGDSPGHGKCESVIRKLELPDFAGCYGAVRANMEEEVLTSFPGGRTAKSFHFTKGVAEADAIVNLCKMKTHALERVTGAVKNVYGFICGAHKAAGHVKYPNASTFARMLADIHRCTDIRLHIMDGIVAMEGNGPGAGDPTEMNVLLFSADPVALDAVFCALVCLDPKAVPTCVQGELAGIGTYHEEKIALSLVSPDGACEEMCFEQLRRRFGKPDFNVDRKGTKKTLLGSYSGFMARMKRPVIDKEQCIKCGICVSHCPVEGKAIDFRDGREQPPVYDYRKCIRCYCCQEMCPQHAITVK